MKTYVNIVSIVLMLLLSACTFTEDSIVDPDPEVSQKSAENIVTANNTFAFNFLKEINESEEEENFMVSPVSLSLALGMAYNGAAGDTKKAFDEVLNYGESNSDVNQFNKNLMKNLSSSSDGSVLEIANSIWIEQTFPVRDTFKQINTTYYNAEVANLDFKDPNSVDVINAWVSDKTHEKIPTIIEEIGDNVMFLINALYFNANWMFQFDKDYTQTESFYQRSGSAIDVEMMTMTADLEYLENEVFSSIILPYEKDKFSMVVLLPNQDKSTNDVIDLLSAQQWDTWLNSFKKEDVSVKMPKFKLEYKNTLNDELIDLGLGIAFSKQANFSKISSIPLFISYVLQKTFIDVKEEGTKAVAVTIIGFEVTANPDEPMPKFFTINRPFVYVIKDNATGSICFVGKVGKPEYKE